jgi:hypothetical protein
VTGHPDRPNTPEDEQPRDIGTVSPGMPPLSRPGSAALPGLDSDLPYRSYEPDDAEDDGTDDPVDQQPG